MTTIVPKPGGRYRVRYLGTVTVAEYLPNCVFKLPSGTQTNLIGPNDIIAEVVAPPIEVPWVFDPMAGAKA